MFSPRNKVMVHLSAPLNHLRHWPILSTSEKCHPYNQLEKELDRREKLHLHLTVALGLSHYETWFVSRFCTLLSINIEAFKEYLYFSLWDSLLHVGSLFTLLYTWLKHTDFHFDVNFSSGPVSVLSEIMNEYMR